MLAPLKKSRTLD